MKTHLFNRSRLLLVLLLAAGTAWAGNFSGIVQTRLDASPLLAQRQLKMRVTEEHGGVVTIELSEGPKTLRDLFRKGIEIEGAGMREAALNEDELKSLQCIRRTIKPLRTIKGLKGISLTGAINPFDLAENDYKQACQQLTQGTAADRDDAIGLLKKAAAAGLPAAQADLAGMYLMGLNAEPDEKQAVQWYRKAAEQGEPRAQFNLGRLIAIGRAGPQNFEEAIQWYRKAAAQDRQLVAKFKSLNALSLLLSTCPQEKLRDAKAALELAQQAQNLDPQNTATVESFAAAYALNGRFPEAVEQQKQWIKILQEVAERNSMDAESKQAQASKRLELYEKNELDIEPVVEDEEP